MWLFNLLESVDILYMPKTIEIIETRKTIVLLAGFIMLMGVLGYTDSLEIEPLLINAFLALMTIFLGSLLSRGSKSSWYGTVIWLTFITTIYVYQIFWHISDDLNPQPDSKYVFVSMSLLCFATFYRVLKVRPSD